MTSVDGTEINSQAASEELVVDDLVISDDEAFVTYEIAAYPADYTLSVLAAMWDEKDILVPKFQRNFVWTIRQASLLIESLLMGLPVPQAFFFVEADGKYLVIDGLQRIMSIVYFFTGYFGEETYQGKKMVFRLTGLSWASPFAGKTFLELTEIDRRKLKNSVLRVINIKQIGPKNDDTSAYHIFERLNTGGTPLTAQEIRNCVYHGDLSDLLVELNRDAAWRQILGTSTLDKHQKDIELLLRVLSFATHADRYEKPMKEFLNRTMAHYRFADDPDVADFKERFPVVCREVVAALGSKPFHPKGRVNASALDSVLGTLLAHGVSIPNDLGPRYKALFSDTEFVDTLSVSTSDVSVVKQRLAVVRKHLT